MQETNVATFSDIKICYGTLPGFKAFRDPNEGSWYIQVLCDVFAEHAHDTHLEDLIKIIGNTLSTRRTDQMHIQTGSNTDRGFFKTLFFNPGYYGWALDMPKISKRFNHDTPTTDFIPGLHIVSYANSMFIHLWSLNIMYDISESKLNETILSNIANNIFFLTVNYINKRFFMETNVHHDS